MIRRLRPAVAVALVAVGAVAAGCGRDAETDPLAAEALATIAADVDVNETSTERFCSRDSCPGGDDGVVTRQAFEVTTTETELFGHLAEAFSSWEGTVVDCSAGADCEVESGTVHAYCQGDRSIRVAVGDDDTGMLTTITGGTECDG